MKTRTGEEILEAHVDAVLLEDGSIWTKKLIAYPPTERELALLDSVKNAELIVKDFFHVD